MPDTFPLLTTRRLQLRQIGPDDVPALLPVFADADAMRWFGTDPVHSEEQMAQIVALWQGWRQLPNPGTRWGIARREGGPLLGTCGLFAWNRGWRRATLGYELGRVAWGQGYMQEALQAVLGWGFREMGLHRIDACIHPDNTASLKLARKLGFVEEGRLRDAGFWLGQYHDLLQFSLLQPEFQPERAPT